MTGQSHSYEHLIREKLRQFPEIRAALEQLCDRCDRRGGLSGRMTLGHHLDPRGMLAHLRCVFGNALRVSRQGAATLSLDAFFQDFGDQAATRQWTEALFRVLGRTPRNQPKLQQALNLQVRQILARWPLQFPRLVDLLPWLERRQALLQQRVERHGEEAVTQWLFGIGNAIELLSDATARLTAAELGAQAFGDSKALRQGDTARLLGEALREFLDPDDLQQTRSPSHVLRMFGLQGNPTALHVTLAGPVSYQKRGTRFSWIGRLHEHGESATLSLDNLEGIDSLDPGTSRFCITCENETPFCRLIDQHLPFPVVYTEGYPNAAVQRFLTLLPQDTVIYHWGDSDLDGLRIAAILDRIRPVTLWRCTRADLRRLHDRLLPLSPKNRQRATHWLQHHPDFRFAQELRHALEHGWLEQESWEPDPTSPDCTPPST